MTRQAQAQAEPSTQGLRPSSSPGAAVSEGRFTRLQGLVRTLERAMDLLDNAIKVPGTNIRIGLDPIVGFLAPGVGDAVTGGMALVAVFLGVHYRVPARVVGLMVWNVLVDTVLGSVPFVGDLFDVAYRSNDRNLRLLKRYRDRGQSAAGSSLGYWLSISGLLLVALLCLLLPLFLVAFIATRVFG